MQGAKIVRIGEEVLRYGEQQCPYSSVELPITGKVIKASHRRPYLVLVLEIERGLVLDLVKSKALFPFGVTAQAGTAAHLARSEHAQSQGSLIPRRPSFKVSPRSRCVHGLPMRVPGEALELGHVVGTEDHDLVGVARREFA